MIGGMITADSGGGNSWVFGIIPAPDDRYLPGWYADENGNHVYVGPRLREDALHIQYSLYGIPIPITVGVRRLTGNMVYASDLTEVVGTYHDGGADDHKATYYTYFGNFMIDFGEADPLIDPSAATAALTIQGGGGFFSVKNALAGETVTIGAKTYTWRASVSTTANEVKIGHYARESLAYLVAAVNGGPGSGTTYGSSTVASTECSGLVQGNTAIFTANETGNAGTALASTETMAYGSFTGAHFKYVARKILQVYANGNLIVDRLGTGQVMPIGARLSYPDGPLKPPTLIPTDGEVKYTFYPGSETQGPDPTILAKEGVSTWTGYRGHMCVMFQDFPLQWFDNTIPTITIVVGDDTAHKTETYIMEASPDPDGTMLALDLAGGMVYADNPSPLYQYSLDDAAFVTQVDMDAARNDCSTIIPWTGQLITADAALEIYQRVSIVDPASGATIQSLGANGGSGIIRQVAHIVPVRVPTPSTPLDTYIFCAQFRTIQIVVADPLSGALQYVWSDDTMESLISTGNLRCGCPGADKGYSKVAYLGVGGVGAGDYKGVWRLLIDGSVQQSIPDGLLLGVTGAPRDSTTPWYNPPNDYSPRGLVYDEPGNGLVVMLDKPGSGDPQRIAYVDADTGEERWNIEIDYSLSAVSADCFWQSNVLPGFLATLKDGVDQIVLEVELSTGSVVEYVVTDDQTTGGSGGTFTHGTIRTLSPAVGDAGGQRMIGFDASSNLCAIYYNRLNDARTTLKYFLEFMAGKIGLAVPDDFEVNSDVTDSIDGGIITQPVKFSALLSSISTVYRLDIIEHGDAIEVLRKQLTDGNDFELAASDLMEIQPGDPRLFVLSRQTDTNLPNAVTLTFLDKAMNYNPNFVFAKRSTFPLPTSNSVDPINLAIPLIITATEAKQLCYLLLYRAWAARNAHSWRLGPEYLRIEPGDVGTVSDGFLQYNVKITKATLNADLSISLNAQSFQSDAAITVEAEEQPVWTPPVFGFVRAQIIPIDSVLLNPADDTAIFNSDTGTMYYSIAPTTRRPWRGGSAQFGLSPSNYSVIGQTQAAPCFGNAVVALASVDNPWMTDTVNVLDIQLTSDTADQLVTITDLELLDYGNLALLGRGNNWEVIQFRDVTSLGNNKYRLSTLLRARRGSEDFVTTHVVGDYFILVDSLIKVQGLPAADLDKRAFYRGYSVNQSPTDGLTAVLRWQANAAKPLRPCLAEAAKVSTDLVVTWARRTRGFGEWADGTPDVPIFETVDIFDIEFYSDGTFATLLGATTSDVDTGAGSGSSEAATVSAAQQTSIFGGTKSSGDTVSVRIRQRGSVTGVAGRNLDATLVIA